MFKILTGATAIVFLLLTAGSVWADEAPKPGVERGFYVSFSPSVVFPFSVDTTSPVLSPATTRTNTGWRIDGGVGYRNGDFRAECDMLYGRNDADHITFSEGGGNVSGYYDMLGATANFFYDIPTGVNLRPYVGLGLGGTHFVANNITLAGFPPTQGSNTLFTYQFMAGVSYRLRDAWQFLLGYRFTGMVEQDYETGGIPLYGDSLEVSAGQVGVQFYF